MSTMENKKPTPEEFETYHKVNNYLNSTLNKSGKNSVSLFPKPTLLWIIILALLAFSSYYGLTTMFFGQDFWLGSLIGNSVK